MLPAGLATALAARWLAPPAGKVGARAGCPQLQVAASRTSVKCCQPGPARSGKGARPKAQGHRGAPAALAWPAAAAPAPARRAPGAAPAAPAALPEGSCREPAARRSRVVGCCFATGPNEPTEPQLVEPQLVPSWPHRGPCRTQRAAALQDVHAEPPHLQASLSHGIQGSGQRGGVREGQLRLQPGADSSRPARVQLSTCHGQARHQLHLHAAAPRACSTR
jgi:hypothetical protein